MELICPRCKRFAPGLACGHCLIRAQETRDIQSIATGLLSVDVYGFLEMPRHFSKVKGREHKPVPARDWESFCGFKPKIGMIPNYSHREKLTAGGEYCPKCLHAVSSLKGEQ